MNSVALFDYAIIGAGMAGASVAYRLSLSGASVVVLEQESQPGYHSTGRSAAMFMETYGTAHTRALTRASRDFFLHPPSGFTEHPILAPRGVLYIGHTGQEGMLDAAYDAYRTQGLEVNRLTAHEAMQMVPCLTPDRLIGAIYDPVASDMDVHGLHQGFLRGMRAHGATLQANAKLESAEYGNAVWTLRTSNSHILRARVVVNAAGAWADAVAGVCGVASLGIQPMRRSAFLFPAPDGTDISHWPTVLGVDESYYFKPDAGVLLGSPANADPVDPQDIVPEELDIAMGIYRIEEVTTLRIRRPSHVWAGLRSFAPDHEFVIGWDSKVPGFFWLAGQGGYGIQTAAGASELASTLLLGQALPAALTDHGVSAQAVDPARFCTSKK
ncbi:NAD(P)/FAD-dependent oxidoreductase [Allopusillimonas ginsengisoli]|uniref:NAD(P)/FAD-dependent oxidoreductase n=1 Tax=Allopusillimonas ginsengisoli TaxID=453575 RepID=UPI0010207880|nr:FAD-binding oxidoreductase [Allopusillimonas ginsengisoli]TEA78722.1 FAD-binding oxidoreductase [Allopusillimonas ginsengisoli]